MLFFFISKHGLTDHMKHIQCDRSFYKEHLYGIAYFIKMVNQEEGMCYLSKLDSLAWE